MVDEDPTISDIVALLGNERSVVIIATLQSLIPCAASDADLCRKLACNAAFLKILLDFADKSAVEASKNPNTTSNELHRAVFKLLVSLTCDETSARHVFRYQDHAFFRRGCRRLLFDVQKIATLPANFSKEVDSECMLLSNLTREVDGAEAFVSALDSAEENSDKVEPNTKSRDAVDILFENFAPKTTENNSSLYRFPHFLFVLANLSQLASFRHRIRDSVNIMVYQRYLELLERYVPVSETEEEQILLPFAQLLRNMALASDMHEFLLHKARIVPYVLFPLYDAEVDQIDDEDQMTKLDLKLQFLPPTKRRAKSAALKQCLLECLYQLSSTRPGRKVLQDAGTYLILREFHRHDTNAHCVFTCENLVDVLIRDEEDFDNVPDIRTALEKSESGHAEPVDPEIEQKLTKINEDLLQNAVEMVSERAARQKQASEQD